MTDPVSAVLEYPEVAMVTIVDPEDGDILSLLNSYWIVTEVFDVCVLLCLQ